MPSSKPLPAEEVTDHSNIANAEKDVAKKVLQTQGRQILEQGKKRTADPRPAATPSVSFAEDLPFRGASPSRSRPPPMTNNNNKTAPALDKDGDQNTLALCVHLNGYRERYQHSHPDIGWPSDPGFTPDMGYTKLHIRLKNIKAALSYKTTKHVWQLGVKSGARATRDLVSEIMKKFNKDPTPLHEPLDPIPLIDQVIDNDLQDAFADLAFMYGGVDAHPAVIIAFQLSTVMQQVYLKNLRALRENKRPESSRFAQL